MCSKDYPGGCQAAFRCPSLSHKTSSPPCNLSLSNGLMSFSYFSDFPGTRLPEKGATTGSIIGAIIGVILLLAIIGTAIAMYRKHRNNKLTGEWVSVPTTIIQLAFFHAWQFVLCVICKLVHYMNRHTACVIMCDSPDRSVCLCFSGPPKHKPPPPKKTTSSASTVSPRPVSKQYHSPENWLFYM